MRGKEYRDFSRELHERAAERARVIKAQLELTYRCNLRCAHCYTDPYNAAPYFGRELSTAEWKRVLGELADLGVLWLSLTGGEVFARPDFFELYDDALDEGFVVVLFTNGTTLTERVIERLKARPPFYLDVSIHAAREESFDRFVGAPGSFKRFRRGLELLRESGLPFRFKTKAMAWNKDEIPEIRKLVESFGKAFSFSTALVPRLDGDLSPLGLRLGPAEIRELETREDIWLDDEDSCRSSRAQLGRATDALYRCQCGTDTVHVSAWGSLGACANQYEARASLRELSVRAAIDDVFGRIRAARYAGDSPCRSCEIFSFCDRSPTPARQETGDVGRPIPYNCDVALDRAERLTRLKLSHPLGARRTA